MATMMTQQRNIASFAVREFPFGIISSVPAQEIPDGAAADSLNWLTKGKKIELRRGIKTLGQNTDGGTGITGLGVAERLDGTQAAFRARARKIEYLADNDQWIEIGTNTLPALANGEDVSFQPYKSLAGAFMYLSSPNSSIYKIVVANLGDITDLSSTTYRGKIKIKSNRMWLWDRKESSSASGLTDKTRLHLSKLDKDEIGDYTAVSSESFGTGNGTTKTFSATLAFKSGNSKRTCFAASLTDGTETFYDNGNGVMVGNLGGTGVINYTTGLTQVTFNTAPANLQAITVSYYHEDATSGGIADFTYTSPTRVAGEGLFLIQNEGGNIQNVLTLGAKERVFHENKVWTVNVPLDDDTGWTQAPEVGKVGIPNWRAAAEGAEGVYYVDDIDQNDPHFKLLQFLGGGSSSEVGAVSLSKHWKLGTTMAGVDLANYRFNLAATIIWGDYWLIACRHQSSSINNTVFIYDRKLKTIDRLDYYVSCFAILNGTLIAGDPLSDNTYTLFSGYDDDEATIANYWQGAISLLGIDRMKKTHRVVVEGDIGPEQTIEVYLSVERGSFALIGSIVGDGAYVDRSQSVDVGAFTLGRGEIGGGSDGISAYHYFRELKWHTDKFMNIQIKFVATGIGYASVSSYKFDDMRVKDRRIAVRYRP